MTPRLMAETLLWQQYADESRKCSLREWENTKREALPLRSCTTSSKGALPSPYMPCPEGRGLHLPLPYRQNTGVRGKQRGDMNTRTQTLFLCTTHTKTTENMLMKHTYCEIQGDLGEPGNRFEVNCQHIWLNTLISMQYGLQLFAY